MVSPLFYIMENQAFEFAYSLSEYLVQALPGGHGLQPGCLWNFLVVSLAISSVSSG